MAESSGSSLETQPPNIKVKDIISILSPKKITSFNT